MADFLCGRMHEKHLNIRQLIIVVAYVLFQAKEHVEGCGGDSHIAVLRNEGTSGRVNYANVETATKLVKAADKRVGELLMQYADLGMDKEEFLKEAKDLIEQLAELREAERRDLKEHHGFLARLFGSALHDDIGLPTAPDAKLLGDEGSGDQA